MLCLHTYFPRAKHSRRTVTPLAANSLWGKCTSILGSYSPITPEKKKHTMHNKNTRPAVWGGLYPVKALPMISFWIRKKELPNAFLSRVYCPLNRKSKVVPPLRSIALKDELGTPKHTLRFVVSYVPFKISPACLVCLIFPQDVNICVLSFISPRWGQTAVDRGENNSMF